MLASNDSVEFIFHVSADEILRIKKSHHQNKLKIALEIHRNRGNIGTNKHIHCTRRSPSWLGIGCLSGSPLE